MEYSTELPILQCRPGKKSSFVGGLGGLDAIILTAVGDSFVFQTIRSCKYPAPMYIIFRI